MTWEEFTKIPMRFENHISGADAHIATYCSTDYRFGIMIITKVLADWGGFRVFGRAHRYYRIGNEVYKSKKKFVEALKMVSCETRKEE